MSDAATQNNAAPEISDGEIYAFMSQKKLNPDAVARVMMALADAAVLNEAQASDYEAPTPPQTQTSP